MCIALLHLKRLCMQIPAYSIDCSSSLSSFKQHRKKLCSMLHHLKHIEAKRFSIALSAFCLSISFSYHETLCLLSAVEMICGVCMPNNPLNSSPCMCRGHGKGDVRRRKTRSKTMKLAVFACIAQPIYGD